MDTILMRDVGDALCAFLRTFRGNTIQIDWGSKRGKNVKSKEPNLPFPPFHIYPFPEVFILSHFHLDHYYGLLMACDEWRKPDPPLYIEKVYYPGIPRFARRQEFIDAIFTMNLMVLGTETGIMEYDFLRAIAKLNMKKDFYYQPLFEGDVIKINSSHFEVLWPRRSIMEEKTKYKIKNALRNFEKALKENAELRELYNRVHKERIFERLLRKEGGRFERHPDMQYESPRRDAREVKGSLPKVVQDANDSLRDGANHLSLGLFEDNRFLFLGDLEKEQIAYTAGSLESIDRTGFQTFIAPHHGTHWHDNLRKIRAKVTLISAGRKMARYFKPQFKDISDLTISTYFNGNIKLPL